MIIALPSSQHCSKARRVYNFGGDGELTNLEVDLLLLSYDDRFLVSEPGVLLP